MSGCLVVLGLVLGCASADRAGAGADQFPNSTFGPLRTRVTPAVTTQDGRIPHSPGGNRWQDPPNVEFGNWSAPHGSAPHAPTPTDPWLAQDKLRHFAMSFAATTFAYAGARTALDPDPAAVLAGIAALAAGFGKELHDARSGRGFSPRDMVWNAAGAALALTLVSHIR